MLILTVLTMLAENVAVEPLGEFGSGLHLIVPTMDGHLYVIGGWKSVL